MLKSFGRRLTALERRRAAADLELPYGMWTTADGREVLFNRKYAAIWQRDASGVVTPADPTLVLERIAATRWFYDGYASPPWANAATRRRCLAILAEWGIAPPAILQPRRPKPRAAAPSVPNSSAPPPAVVRNEAAPWWVAASGTAH